MIHLMREQPTPEQLQEMLEQYAVMIKIVVDIRRELLAGGGEMHADCADVPVANRMICGEQTGILRNSGLSLNH